MKRIVALVLLAVTSCGAGINPLHAEVIPGMGSGPQCIKSVNRPAGVTYSTCYNIEPWLKQRVKARLFDFATDKEVVRFGPWVMQNGVESTVIWNPVRYVYMSGRVVVVYS